MRRLTLLLLIILTLSPITLAQNGYTTVTATVLDPTGALYTNSQVSVSFYDPGTNGKLALISGSTFQQSFSGYGTDSFGRFSITLPDNGVIASTSGATGTQWTFTICYSDRATCFQARTPINCLSSTPAACSSSTMDISAYLQSVAATLPSTSSGGAFKYINLPFNSSPNFSSSGNTAFNFVMTGNVITPTFLDTSSRAGTIFIMDLQQDAIGGRTFAFPANVLLPVNFTFNIAPSAHNQLAFWWNGSIWDAFYILNAGGGGSSLTPAGVNGDVQCKLGVGLNTCHINDTGVVITITEPVTISSTLTTSGDAKIGGEVIPRGPNPYVDPRQYGMRSLNSSFIPAVPGITGTINSGSSSLTVSTSNCPNQASSQCFTNGDGIVVIGAGPSQSMTAPTPTVVPSLPAGPTGVTVTVPGPAGSSTYNYKIIAADKGRGMTAPGPTTTITNGKANLGARQVNITSCSRSGQTVTCLTSSAHELIAGAAIIINQASDGSFSGDYLVATAPDNTHFTYTSGFDTLSGASTSSTGGIVHWFNENLISWSHVTGAHQYIICSDRGGGGFVPIGISAPDNTASSITDMALAFDDLGSPMRDNFVLPYWAGANPCAASSPQNDELVTTIVSGAPGTVFTLAATASTSVTSNTTLFDNSPSLLAATQANTQVPVNIPYSLLGFVFNSYLTLPNLYNICQLGGVAINDTIQLAVGGRWAGNCPPVNTNPPGFSWQGFPGVSWGPAYPNFYMANQGSTVLDSLQFSGASTANQKIFVLLDIGGVPSGVISNLNFQTGTGNDYMGMGLIFRGQLNNSPSNILMNGQFLFAGGGSGVVGSTTTPMFYADPAGFHMANASMGGRGIATRSPSQPFGAVNIIDNLYMNGGVTSLVTMTSGGGSQFLRIKTVTIDTVGRPLFANLNSSGSKLTIDDLQSGPSFDGVGTPPLVSGFGTPVIGAIVGAGYNRNQFTNVGIGLSSTQPAGTSLVQQAIEGDIWAGNTHSIFINAPPMSPPSVAVSVGGLVPVGSYTYKVVPVWQNGGEGNYSLPSSTATTTSGNQTVTLNWTTAPGNPSGYDIYRNGVLLLCSIPNTSSISIVDANSSGCGNSAETIPTGGPTMLMPGVQGIAAPKFQGGGYAGTVKSPVITSNYTVTTLDYDIPADPTGGGFNVTLTHLVKGQDWTIVNVSTGANLVTVIPDSGTILTPAGASSSVTIAKGVTLTFFCDGTVCYQKGGNSAGANNINNCTQFGMAYYSAPGTANAINCFGPPATIGIYEPFWLNPTAVATVPQVGQRGSTVNTQGSSYTLTGLDRSAWLRFSGSTTPTLTMPAIALPFASNFPFRITNYGSGNLTFSPTTNTINGAATLALFPGWNAFVSQDNTPNWFADRIPSFEAFPSCPDSGTNHLNFSSTLGILCGTAGGGGSAPGGSPTQWQYNNTGVLGGMAESSYNSANGTFTWTQKANGNDMGIFQRFTNSSPTGNYQRFNDSAGTLLFNLDISGNWFANSYGVGSSGSRSTYIDTTGFHTKNTGLVCFSSTSNAEGSCDTGISRDSAGITGIGNGTQGDESGTLVATIYDFPIANNGSTATVVNKYAILTGAPSTATVALTSSTSGVIGIVTSGAGTTGNARVAFSGIVSCVFDGATTAGDYVQESSTAGGSCHDIGATYPTSGDYGGRVLTTNGGAGTYLVDLTPELKASAGGSATPCTTTALSLQYNNGGSFGCLAEFTYASSTITGSATAKVDLSAAPPATGLKIPTAAAAAPTVIGNLAIDSTKGEPVFGDGVMTRPIGTLSQADFYQREEWTASNCSGNLNGWNVGVGNCGDFGAPIAGHYGVVTIGTGTTINTLTRYGLRGPGNNGNVFPDIHLQVWTTTWVARLADPSDGSSICGGGASEACTINATYRMGIMDAWGTSPPVNGYYFEAIEGGTNNSNIKCVTMSASTPTSTDSGVALDTNFHTFRIFNDGSGSSVKFYIDNVLKCTNTTNITSASPLFPDFQSSNQTANDKRSDLDFWSMYIATPR